MNLVRLVLSTIRFRNQWRRLRMTQLRIVVVLFSVIFSSLVADPQSQPPAPSSPPQNGTMMLTIFLKHDQSKTLDEINQHLKQTGFTENFPPAGTEAVSWYVMMGIGQVVTLRFPAEKLRDVNLAIERGAWGAYRTEFYPTYDYLPVWKASRQKPAH
jgi:hypothetical protein